ncbi:hemerythrin domain-containing protein [Streptomyces sp. NPDC102437]|uniref:hemerythrin domain-containing protein n=1 Tax=Streptomyces sp. NPDC102437 TaxID=3366175 RepID=UPI003800B332
MTEQGGDVIVELTADHRELEELFSQIELQPIDHPQRRVLADRLTAELVRHTITEELHLYPVVRRHVSHGPALADKELADHARVEQMLKSLEDRSVCDPRFNDTIAKLKFEVASHVREEEHELFPRLSAALPPEQLDELGRLVRRAREAAPFRIRASLPSTSPANRLLVPGAGLVDRVRNLFHSHRTTS